ncbi:MAG: hypothetical protein N3E45_15325 [Oscillatoriaceae bacterium SKW80]|nr:hypothetical protein [Oscillatoriaceae bacterium SKYG93]MCX8122170.1 hypothetical protein [Oscillatoriaceae bacterium SKW80]MDW8454457.1 Calx-beta domain-containing protein [Oscillatoriaceae cyanobacterium SKYGB_i_bin93]HIK29321.1 hypothetical protein [Oscillatoriaceae cyanobacterium M7585_C2015_266]
MQKYKGSSGIDILDLSSGNQIELLDGDDTLIGSPANEIVSGGQGNDSIIAQAGKDIVSGDEDDDDISGDEDDDTLNGGDGNDLVSGGSGNDTVFGGADQDLLFGEDGNDYINGGSGDDAISGGLGNDTLIGEEGEDLLFGDADNDIILAGNDNDIASGGEGNDQIFGEEGDDELDGGVGADILYGGNGNDLLRGDPQDAQNIDPGTQVPIPNTDTVLTALFGYDYLDGGDGNDTVIGGIGNDQIAGGIGKDLIYGNQGNDVIFSGEDDDTVKGGQGSDIIYGNQGNDLITGDLDSDNIAGGKGNDTLYGNANADTLNGNQGDDLIYGGQDNDVAHGGQGNDRIFGDAGDDTLYGDIGSDTLKGGAGSDVFSFALGHGGPSIPRANFIEDFETERDFIELAAGLQFENLNIFQGSGDNANNTIIQDILTGEYIVVLLNVNAKNIDRSKFLPAPETPAPVPTPTPSPQPSVLKFQTNTFSVNEGGGTATITVTRTGGTDTAVTATITLADGQNNPATAGTDYDNTPLTVTIAAGQTSGTVQVPIIDDTLPETNETINLTLTNPSNGASIDLNGGTATLEIVDNDNPGKLEFTAPTFTVKEDGTVVQAIKVKRTDGSNGVLSASITLTAGTAILGTDFNNPSPPITVSFADGDTQEKTITLPPGTIIDDVVVDGLKTIQLALTNPNVAGAIGTQATATLNIQDNDMPTVQIKATDPDAAEATLPIPPNPGKFTITRFKADGTPDTSPTPLVVNFTLDTSPGSATENTDYNASPPLSGGTVTIPGGTASVDININVLEDLIQEGTEKVKLTLASNPNYNIDPNYSSDTVNIQDNDVDTVKIIATQPNASETGPTPGQFTITVVNPQTNTPVPASQNLTISYSVSGSAIAGSDYNALTGTVSIPAGQTSATINLNPIDDSTVEIDETVIVTLTPNTTYNVLTGQDKATVTIEDNEPAKVIILPTDAEAEEVNLDTAKFTIRRLGDKTAPLTVNYTIDTGTSTATAGVDFAALSGVVNIPAGQRDAFVTITPFNDTGSEPEPLYETLTLALTPPANPGLAGFTLGSPTQGTIFLLNNGQI